MKQSVDVEFKTSADTSGADRVKHALGSLTTEAEKANAAGKGVGIEMGAAMSAARGNVNGIIKLVISLGKRVGILKDISLGAIAAVSAAVMSLFKLFSASKDLVAEVFNLNGVPKDISAASAALLDLKNSAGEFANEIKSARDEADRLSKSFNSQVDAVNRLVKAQNELRRQQALAAAATDDEKATINAVYDALNTQSDDKAAAQKLERREKDLNEEEARLLAEIANAEKNRDAFRSEAQRMLAAAKEQRTNWAAGMVKGLFGKNPNDTAASYLNAETNARTAADDEDAKIEDAKKKLDALREERSRLSTEIKTAEASAESHIVAANTKQIETYQKSIDDAQKKLAALQDGNAGRSETYQKAIAEREAVEKKAALEMAKEKEEADKKAIEAAQKAAEDRAKVERDAERKMLDDISRKRMADLKRAHDERMKQLEKEKAKWEESQARAIDAGRGGFAAFRAAERDAQREKDRAEAINGKNRKDAERELARLEREMGRGKAFNTDSNRKRAKELRDYISKLNDENPYESQMLKATQNIEHELERISSTLGAVGL